MVGISSMRPCSKNTYKAQNEVVYNYFELHENYQLHIEHALNTYIQCTEYIFESDKEQDCLTKL